MEGSKVSAAGHRVENHEGRDSRALRARCALGIGAVVFLGLVIASAFLSVNILPIIGDDSVVYLEHSRNLGEIGFVQYGYRQVGYPLVLAATRLLGNAMGAEPLLSMAMLQRLLLVAAAWLAWRFWRWWSLPLIAFLVAAETVAFTNFLLNESLAMPIGVLLVYPMVRFVEILHADNGDNNQDGSAVLLLAGLIVVGVVGLYTLRFTYAVFGAVPLVLAVAGWRTEFRRVTIWMVGIALLLMGAFSLATSLENQREHGVFFPTVSGLAVEYYFAWQGVFVLQPENRTDPELADFFDEGFVYDFIRSVDAMNLGPQERRELFKKEIEAMLDAAGESVNGSKVESALSALAGGRFDDVQPAVTAAIAIRRVDVDSLIYINRHARRNGPERFVNEYNDGQLAEAVITDPIGVVAPLPSGQDLIGGMLPIGLVVMLVGLGYRPTRALSAIGLLVVVSFALGVGWIRADNLRFVMPTSAFGIATATGVLSLLMTGRFDRRHRPAAQSSDPVDDNQRKD